MWALGGVALLFAFAVARLGGRGLQTLAAGLTPDQWAILALGTAFFVYTEGVVALQRRWVPRLVVRARELHDDSDAVFRALAPLYGMSLIGAPRRTAMRAWAGTGAIVVAVLLVRTLPAPWRGIVDIAVAAALAWGLLVILAHLRAAAE